MKQTEQVVMIFFRYLLTAGTFTLGIIYMTANNLYNRQTLARLYSYFLGFRVSGRGVAPPFINTLPTCSGVALIRKSVTRRRNWLVDGFFFLFTAIYYFIVEFFQANFIIYCMADFFYNFALLIVSIVWYQTFL